LGAAASQAESRASTVAEAAQALIKRIVGITADVGSSRALLSDRQCHFYGSVGSVPEAFIPVSPVLCNYRASCI
jgi:hypothetical protein